jgi:hypothetical protein
MTTWCPTACVICRRTAMFKSRNKDVCEECLPLTTKNLDEWEKSAIAEMAAQVREHLGMDEQESVEFVKFVFLGVGDSIRRQMDLGTAPF